MNAHAMNDAPTTVLLVEDDPADAKLIQQALAGTAGGPFRVECVTRLADALARLGRGGIELVLLDLTLHDGEGLEAFDQVFQAAPNALILVLVLSGPANEETAQQAVQRGAHDYLAKGHADAHWFLRTQQCDEGQGFHFSHPVSAEDFSCLLVTGSDELPRRRLG